MTKLFLIYIRKIRALMAITALSIVVFNVAYAGNELIIDDFASANAWVPQYGAPAPALETTGGAWGADIGVKFGCDFGTAPSTVTRRVWDRQASLDLTNLVWVSLDLYIDNPQAISYLTVYFKSGDGWYYHSVNGLTQGWQTIGIPLLKLSTTSPQPLGLNSISAIRISPWRNSNVLQDAFIFAKGMRAWTPDVNVINGGYTDNIIRLFKDYGINVGQINYADVERGMLSGTKLVVLPESPISVAAMDRIEKFVTLEGGKVLATATKLGDPDYRLAALLGIKSAPIDVKTNLYGYIFHDVLIPHLPVVPIFEARWAWASHAVPDFSASDPARVIATWNALDGTSTSDPAWLANGNGLYTRQIPLYSDFDNKPYALAALISYFVPSLLPSIHAVAVKNIGKIAESVSYSDAVANIQALGLLTPRSARVNEALAQADSRRNNALLGQAMQNVNESYLGRRDMQMAYALAQSPGSNDEVRAVWTQANNMPYDNWDVGLDNLTKNGFNTIMMNAATAGIAFYNTTTALPVSNIVTIKGDQISAVVKAAHLRDAKAHMWVMTWNMAMAPKEYIASMRAAGRTQVDSKGKDLDWLSPCHVDNWKLEKDVILEIANNYTVDGIQLDFIRFPNDASYDASCRSEFEKYLKSSVANWPADVTGNAPLKPVYDDWKAALITNFVQEIYLEIQKINNVNFAGKPKIKVSAAVFPEANSARAVVSQDWMSWANNRYVDFLFPMSYADNLIAFNAYVSDIKSKITNEMPFYPSIGAYMLKNDGVISQITATRKQGINGFGIFIYNRELGENYLSLMGLGTTVVQ